jgi:hypothetical protein
MMKKSFDAKGSVGDIRPVTGSSMALNVQRNVGGEKPSAKGNHSPGGTRPERVNESPEPIPMPK